MLFSRVQLLSSSVVVNIIDLRHISTDDLMQQQVCEEDKYVIFQI